MPKKPKSERKVLTLRIRVTPDQRQLLTSGASIAGFDVSAWMRALSLAEARKLGASK